MAIGVDNYISEQRHARGFQRLLHEASVEYFDCNVLHTRTVSCEMCIDTWVAWAHQNNSHATRVGGDDCRVLSRCRLETKRSQKLNRRRQIGNGNNNMIDATGDCVECATKCIGCLAWRWFGANFGNFNAMCFGEQNAKQLFCEIWINLLVDCPLPAQI